MLKLVLPFVVGRKGEPFARLAFGVNRKQTCSVIKHRFFSRLFCLGPFAITQRAEAWIRFADSNITRDQKRLLQRDVKFCSGIKFQNQHFLTFFASHKTLESEEFSDSVFEMDYRIAFIEFAEINLRPVCLFLSPFEIKPSRPGVPVSSEELSIG